jgi:hypothetical protein
VKCITTCIRVANFQVGCVGKSFLNFTLHYHVASNVATGLKLKVQHILNRNLESGRDWITSTTENGWDDEDYLTKLINPARMRAKYYGAKVIINRPYLFAALHYPWHIICTQLPSQSPMPVSDRHSEQASPGFAPTADSQRQGSHMGPSSRSEERSLENLHPEIRSGVELCIQAAIRSTTVFDKVPPRLIVTNIFGTAHA